MHHKISTKDLTYTSPSGKTRKFRNVKILNKFISKKEKEIEKLNIIKSKNKLTNLKSDYFMQKLFDNIQKRISLKILTIN